MSRATGVPGIDIPLHARTIFDAFLPHGQTITFFHSVSIAAHYGHFAIVRRLLPTANEPEIRAALYDAAAYGHLEIVRFFRRRGYHCTSDDADAAARNGHLEIVRNLRKHGIHCTQEGANGAAENGHIHVVIYLCRRNVKCSPLAFRRAINNAHWHVVQYMLDHYSVA